MDAPEQIGFDDAAAFEAWLVEHGASSPGIGLRLRKKAPGIVALTYSDALDVALCFGWIDGVKHTLDEQFWVQRFTPRRARSRWSKINRDRVAALEAAGRMREPGRLQVALAKADGRWDAAYDGARTATVPDDLAAALAEHPVAAAGFAELNGANRYAILWRVQDAKRAETRARRIAQFVEMLERGETLH
jgi:uncharacterized protein YdeI (YjbR/CyaY-like superfamily)